MTTTDEAIQFLEQHQPFPPTKYADDHLFRRLNEIIKYFSENYDVRAVPLLLGVFGEGDGHGVYQLIENTIRKYPADIVVPELVRGMTSSRGTIRCRSAEISSCYDRSELVGPLRKILGEGNFDERIAAVTALGTKTDPAAKEALKEVLYTEKEPEVIEAIREALEL